MTAPVTLQTRCWHHGDREAVCRCLSCRRSFCRECVTEHEERFLCSDCLAKSGPAESGVRRWRAVAKSALLLLLAVILFHGVFYGFGRLLQRLSHI